MPNEIQSGTIMVQQSAIPGSLAVESESYCRDWRSLGIVESSSLKQTAQVAGLHVFFMAGELRAIVPAWGGQNSLRRGVRRLLAQTQLQQFNCLELSRISRKYFLGIPYVSIAAHPRHIQQGCQMQSVEQRARDNAAGAQQQPSSGTPEGLNIDGCLQN